MNEWRGSMIKQWIPKAIGQLTDVRIIRGRENVPTGDDFAWWSMHYEYKNIKTCEDFTLEQLQDKYNLGFAQKKLWDIIERDYTTEEVYVKNVNHPKYDKNDKSNNIVFED
jgi:hypothetical protein